MEEETKALAPRYFHDCTACKYLGQLGKDDLYVCVTPRGTISTVVARRSSVDHDYSSGLGFALAPSREGREDDQNPLKVALTLAIARGYKMPSHVRYSHTDEDLNWKPGE